MRDGTFFKFIEDYNEFKRLMSAHISLTDYRDFETYMYVRAIYNLLKKIPLFKIFFNHQMHKMGKKRHEEMKAREKIMKLQQKEIIKQKESREFANKIKI